MNTINHDAEQRHARQFSAKLGELAAQTSSDPERQLAGDESLPSTRLLAILGHLAKQNRTRREMAHKLQQAEFMTG